MEAEIKLIFFIVIGAGLAAGGDVVGYKMASAHYESLLLKQSNDDNQALAQEQARRVAAERQAEQTAADAHARFAQLKDAADAASAALADRVRDYESLRARTLSAARCSTGGTAGAPVIAASDFGLAAAARSATDACLTDAARLAALQQYVKGEHP